MTDCPVSTSCRDEPSTPPMSGTSHRRALALALFAALALLVPSGATIVPTNGPSDPIGSQIELVPASGGGGAYADVEDGDLVVDVSGSNPAVTAEGLNPSSVTRFDDVFLIHNTGNQHAEVWMSHSGEGLTLTVAGDPIESPEDATQLGPNESVAVDLTFDTTDLQAIEDLDSFTVHTREYNATDDTQNETTTPERSEPDDDAPDRDRNEDDRDDAAEDDANDDSTPDTDQTPTTAKGADGTQSTGDGNASGEGATDTTVSAVDGETEDVSNATQTVDANYDASETQTTPFETLAVVVTGQWPLGIMAALVLGIAGLLVRRRPHG